MTITFTVLDRGERADESRKESVFFVPSNWDDYSFKTSFNAVLYDAGGQRVDLGTVKIGYPDQPHGCTQEALPKQFEELPTGWFSLGQDVSYYHSVREKLSQECGAQFLRALGDVVADASLLRKVQNEQVFRNSLMRGVSLSVIHGQFQRVLAGQVMLTDFRFAYRDPGDERNAPIDLDFRVKSASKPPTNVHVLIGRNASRYTQLTHHNLAARCTHGK